MGMELKSNILLVGLEENFNKRLSKKLSGELGMQYVNVRELVEYELVDEKNVLEQGGIEYYKKRERKALKRAAGFENTIIDISYDFLTNNFTVFETDSIKLYIRFPKEMLGLKKEDLSEISFEDRDNWLVKCSDFVILNTKKDIKSCMANIYNQLEDSLNDEINQEKYKLFKSGGC